MKVYNWDKLQSGNVLKGPTIVEATETTVFVPRGRRVTTDEYLNLIMEEM